MIIPELVVKTARLVKEIRKSLKSLIEFRKINFKKYVKMTKYFKYGVSFRNNEVLIENTY